MIELRLSGSRVVLRKIVEADMVRPLQILLEPEISQWWPEYDAERLRADTLDDAQSTSLAVELLTGEVIGLIMFTEEMDPYYKSASIDITLTTSCIGGMLVGPSAAAVRKAERRCAFYPGGFYPGSIDR